MNELVAVDTELAQIEDLMRTDRAAYFRDEGKQSRYRDLLVQREGRNSQPEPESNQVLIPIASTNQFVAEHGSLQGYDQYVNLSRRAADFALAVPAGERAEFIGSVECLPDEVAQACFAEIMRPKPWAGLTGEVEMAMFADLPEGKLAIREWGAQAARNHATVRARVQRVREELEPWDDGSFCDWHDSLSPVTKVAVYRMLLR